MRQDVCAFHIQQGGWEGCVCGARTHEAALAFHPKDPGVVFPSVRRSCWPRHLQYSIRGKQPRHTATTSGTPAAVQDVFMTLCRSGVDGATVLREIWRRHHANRTLETCTPLARPACQAGFARPPCRPPRSAPCSPLAKPKFKGHKTRSPIPFHTLPSRGGATAPWSHPHPPQGDELHGGGHAVLAVLRRFRVHTRHEETVGGPAAVASARAWASAIASGLGAALSTCVSAVACASELTERTYR